MARKEKPCLLADTHAGAGVYNLDGQGEGNREWEGGIGKLLAREPGTLPSLIEGYLRLAGLSGPGREDGSKEEGPPEGKVPPIASGVPVYPGSPALMARCLRPGDRLVCFEQHPRDYAALGDFLRGVPRAELRREDGFRGLRGLLPPPSRRALVLIDPPYEVKEDYRVLPAALEDALARFSTGTYLVWYPLLGAYRPSGELPERLMEIHRGNRCRVEVYTRRDRSPREDSPRGMYGSGLVIYNPPWTLRSALEESLPVFGSLLGAGSDAWMLRWEPEAATPEPERGLYI
jgi:23S rRNA (adenine2030-N6)-methyltransferase